MVESGGRDRSEKFALGRRKKKSDKKGIDWAEEGGGRRTAVGKSSVEWRLEDEEEGMDTFYYPGTTRRALVVKF